MLPRHLWSFSQRTYHVHSPALGVAENTWWCADNLSEIGGWWSLTQNQSSSSLPENAIECDSSLSPVDTIMIRGRKVLIKRDDQLHLPGSQISGNKARKLFLLNGIPVSQFPNCLVSYGGSQSNAMLALAAIVHSKNKELKNSNRLLNRGNKTPPIQFVYYTKTLPRFLSKNPSGNLLRAQSLGMELRELRPQEYNEMFGGEHGGMPEAPRNLQPPVKGCSLFIPQGGALAMALYGSQMLAKEVHSYWSKEGNGGPLSLVLPGGTCTTAVFVHHSLQSLLQVSGLDIQVIVVPCVGDAAYARRQMISLSEQIGAATNNLPTVLSPSPTHSNSVADRYYTFAQPHETIFKVFRELRDEHNLSLDLIYGAPSWAIMLRHWQTKWNPAQQTNFDPERPFAGRQIMYVHSGGLEGIDSQLHRYKHKGLIPSVDN